MTPFAILLHLKLTANLVAQCKASFENDELNTKFMNANYFFKQKDKFQQIRFDVETLDELTEGGIDLEAVTEIFGEAGSGKTQLCLQLALNCALPTGELKGLNGRTCYVSTDKSFPVKRLAQMVENERWSVHNINFLDLIHVWEYYELADLQFFVREELPTRLVTCPNIRLVIIDSIAGIFRCETDYIKRARDMREIIHEMITLADRYNFAIVVTNHVTAVPQVDASSKNESACGQAWNNLVDVKIRVKKTNYSCYTEKSGMNPLRNMEIIYSPRLGVGKANFAVDSFGVIDPIHRH